MIKMEWLFWLMATAALVNFGYGLKSSADIYAKLVDVIKDKSADAENDFLDKHYFTENKNDSIWKYSMDEAEKLLNQKYDLDELVTWEKEVRDLRMLFKYCSNGKQSRPDCPSIFDRVHRYMKDWQWPALRGEFFRRFKAPIRTAFQSMVMLMFSSMTKRPWVKTYKEANDWYDNISHEYSEVGKFYADFSKKIHEERSWDFSAPEVCQYRRFMWKDFEQPACETRWRETDPPGGPKNKRSAVNHFIESEREVNIPIGLKQRETRSTDKQLLSKARKSDTSHDLSEMPKKREKDDDDDDDDDDKSSDSSNTSEEEEKDPFFKTFAGNSQDQEIKIGGFASDFEFIMKGRFKDETAGKEIIVDQRYINVRETTKGEVIEEMISEAYAKRTELVKSKVAEMDKYVQDTYGAMRKAELLFLKNVKKQIKKWQSKNNIYIPQ